MNNRDKVLISLGAGVIALVSILGYLIWSGYRAAIHSAEMKTSDYAVLLQSRLDATLRRADAELKRLAVVLPNALQESSAVSQQVQMRGLLKQSQIDFAEVSGFAVFDEKGVWRYASVIDVLPRVNIGDRAYFRALSANPQAGLEISEILIARTTGRPGLVLARALRDSDGGFRGVVVALLELEHFRKLFQSIDVGVSGNISIYRSDKFTQVMRWPEVSGKLNMVLPPDSPVRTALTATNRMATLSITAATDGISRIYGMRSLPDYPFFVGVGLARNEALAGWRSRSLAISLCALLLLGLLIGALRRLWRADAERFRLAAIVENSNDAIYSMGLDGTVLSWNGGAERMLGYAAADAIGRAASFVEPSDRPSNLVQNTEAVLSGKVVTRESDRMTKDGRKLSVLSSQSPIKDSAGSVIGISIIVRDISAFKQAQAATLDREAQFRATFEQAAVGIAHFDLQECFIKVNQRYCELVGYESEELLGKPAELLIYPDDVRIGALPHQQLVQGSIDHYAQDKRYRRKDGTAIWVTRTESLARGSDGTPLYFIRVVEDITYRKQAEAALRIANERANGLLASAMDAIVSVDAQQHIVLFNAAAERLFGYSGKDVIGQSLDRLIPLRARGQHPQHMETFSRTAVTTRGMGKLGQISGLRANGQEFPIEASISQTGSGASKLFTVILRDISDRIQAEQARASLETQLRESQKMEAIGTLAGGIAHDFNNILSAILGNTELARQDSVGNSEVLLSLGEIHKASIRARDLVQQILTFSRRQPTNRQAIDLTSIVTEAARLLQVTMPARIALDVYTQPDVPFALADATQILQVILNLVTNAMHALSDCAGRISIRLDSTMLDARLASKHSALGILHQTRPGRMVRLTVSDDGPGMNSATLARIFEPFFTTKPVNQGTGLGLAVVLGIVQTHEGAIVVESQPGQGATFSVYLPAVEKSATPDEFEGDRVAQILTTDKGTRLLHIDDDPMPLALFKRYFGRHAYRVTSYTDPRAALDALQADPLAFDLVLTDYNMPDVSGLEVARRVREINAQIPVVVLSGFIDETLSAQAESCGIREIISKSEPVMAVLKAVQRVVRSTH